MRVWICGAAMSIGCGRSAGGGVEGRQSAPPEAQPAAVPPVGLSVVALPAGAELECVKHDLAVRVVRQGRVLGEIVLEGECHGACTPEARAEGEAARAEAEAAVANGASDNVASGAFTQCVFTGAALARIEPVGDRVVALLSVDHRELDNEVRSANRIATADCGAPWISDDFGAMWATDALVIAATGDDLTVSTRSAPGAPGVVVYQVTFDPSCRTEPVETVAE